ncbi:MAG TPA: enolase C-terminal domain-like protein [Steroidobacter sp.]
MSGSWLTESVISNPMSQYPQYWQKRSSWYQTQSCAVIEVVLEDGTRGYGFVGGAKGSAVPALLDEQIRHLVVGRSVFETGLVQEQLLRATVFYGRGGLVQCLLSGIDLALWDAKGKLLQQPVYNLIGGKGQESLEVYYTGNDPTALAEFGLKRMKIAVPYGPPHGEEGMKKNEEVVARAREIVGPEGWLALDIYMSWNVRYTLEMARRLEPYKIAWFEEPVPPDDYGHYRHLREVGGLVIAGGEHEYTLEGFRRLIEEGCVDVVQPDIYRAGGITGLLKIAALAKAHHKTFICHGVGSPTYHLQVTHDYSLTPMVEYIDIYRGSGARWVLTDDPRPKNAKLALSTAPGFGYDLDRAAFEPGATVAPIW